jgi:hypothetical protein
MSEIRFNSSLPEWLEAICISIIICIAITAVFFSGVGATLLYILHTTPQIQKINGPEGQE